MKVVIKQHVILYFYVNNQRFFLLYGFNGVIIDSQAIQRCHGGEKNRVEHNIELKILYIYILICVRILV